MKSSNLAIVFVDIAGFTERTGQQSRTESAAWLRRYEELLLPLLKTFGGHRVKTIGDAYLCTFVSPTDALLFGMAAQDRIHEHNQAADPQERFDIRVAVNVGEVRQQRRDIFGEPVNIASRLEGQTPIGEIWFTEAVYLAMTRSEVPTEQIGFRDLKGIKDSVRLYRVPKGTGYRLEGDSSPPLSDEDSRVMQYPYGGIGLKRASERGWSLSLAEVRGRVRGASDKAAGGLRFAGSHLRSVASLLGKVPPAVWYALAGIAVLAMLASLLWPTGPYAEVDDALGDGHLKKALALINKHKGKNTPEGMTWEAHVLLVQESPPVERAGSLLIQALGSDPELLESKRVRRDLVSALNRSRPGQVAEFIEEKIGDSAVPDLLEGSRSRNYWERWNSIRLLQKMGAMEKVDLGQAYIQDLRFAGSCNTRKRAARKLAEMKDRRALGALRKAKERSFIENLCMGGALENAIKAIDEP